MPKDGLLSPYSPGTVADSEIGLEIGDNSLACMFTTVVGVHGYFLMLSQNT